jgi:hypothetical protein
MLNELLAELRELAIEGEVPAGGVAMEPYAGALSGGKRILIKLSRPPIDIKKRLKAMAKRKGEPLEKVGMDEVRAPKPKPPPKNKVGQAGFPTKLATRGVKEMNVLTRGLKYKAVELDKKSEVLKDTGGVTMKQQSWLDRNVLHPVTRINDQLDRMNAKVKKAFFESATPLGELLAELRDTVE